MTPSTIASPLGSQDSRCSSSAPRRWPVSSGDPRFEALLAEASFDEPTVPEARRAIVVVEAERISDSCGYGVPLMSYGGERPHMHLSKAKRLRAGGPDALARYVAEHNAESIDGLPAVRVARELDGSVGDEETTR